MAHKEILLYLLIGIQEVIQLVQVGKMIKITEFLILDHKNVKAVVLLMKEENLKNFVGQVQHLSLLLLVLAKQIIENGHYGIKEIQKKLFKLHNWINLLEYYIHFMIMIQETYFQLVKEMEILNIMNIVKDNLFIQLIIEAQNQEKLMDFSLKELQMLLKMRL